MNFFYVYILQCVSERERFYSGITEDLKARLVKHNAYEVPDTAKFRPWQIKTAVAFTDESRLTPLNATSRLPLDVRLRKSDSKS